MLNENKNLKKLFSDDLCQIKPPVKLHKDIRNRILSDTNSYKVTKSKKKIYVTSSVAIATLLVFGGGFVSPSLANVLHKLPIVGPIYNDFQSDIGLQKAYKMGLTQEYQKTITSKNIEVTLTKVYYDGVNLSIAYNLKNNSEMEWPDPPKKGAGAIRNLLLKGSHEFKINGSTIHGGFGDENKKTGPREYEGLLQIYPHEFPKENKFTLELIFSEIQGVKGDWKFKIPVAKEKVKGTVHSFAPNFKIKALGGEIIIKKVDFTPTAIGLDTETIMKGSKGKDILFSIMEVGADNGVSGHTEILENGKELTVNRSTFSPLKEVPESITIKAYNVVNNTEEVTFKVLLKK